jgi:hypothetical protein
MKVDPDVGLSADALLRGLNSYQGWHWGRKPRRVLDWNDPDIPATTLISCGRLVRIGFRPFRSQNNRGPHPRRNQNKMFCLTQRATEKSYLAYNPDTRPRRLYLLVDRQASRALAQDFWELNRSPTLALARLARVAGGRQVGSPYARVKVKPVGMCTELVYFTHKQGDGPSFYRHPMGEQSGVYPILAADQRGRFWLAGGNYTVPTPGITD